MSNVKKTFISGAVCREFESEAPAGGRRNLYIPCRMQQRTQFTFQMCREGDGDGS